MADIIYYSDNSCLYHSRTKGSKNGNRRFQFFNGRYTEEGLIKKREAYQASKKAKDNMLNNMGTKAIKEKIAESKAKDEYNSAWDKKHPDPDKEYAEAKSRNIDNVDRITKALQNMNGEAIKNLDKYISNNMHSYSTSDVNVKDLSDKELVDRINRIRNEKTYAELTTKKVADQGAVKVRDVLETVGSLVSIAAGGVAIYKSIDEIKKK